MRDAGKDSEEVVVLPIRTWDFVHAKLYNSNWSSKQIVTCTDLAFSL